jgi:hypothetical protein
VSGLIVFLQSALEGVNIGLRSEPDRVDQLRAVGFFVVRKTKTASQLDFKQGCDTVPVGRRIRPARPPN